MLPIVFIHFAQGKLSVIGMCYLPRKRHLFSDENPSPWLIEDPAHLSRLPSPGPTPHHQSRLCFRELVREAAPALQQPLVAVDLQAPAALSFKVRILSPAEGPCAFEKAAKSPWGCKWVHHTADSSLGHAPPSSQTQQHGFTGGACGPNSQPQLPQSAAQQAERI